MKLKFLLIPPVVALASLALPLMASAALPAAPAPDGSELYNQRCKMCHSLNPGQHSPMGPNLAGVVGRKAGMGEFRYSSAMKGADVTWTRAKLDEFLASPAKLISGTRMYVSVGDKAERAAIIDFLAGGKS